MADPYIGEIRMFAGNYAPRDWALCNGQLVDISQNPALYAIINTYYGGDGRVTMGLPNLEGRAVMGTGTGPGLTPRSLGYPVGTAGVALNASQIGVHRHQLNGSTATGGETTAEDNVFASTTGKGTAKAIYTVPTSMEPAAPEAIEDSTGGGRAHNNVQPFLGMNFIICLVGNFPPRS